MGKGSTLRTQRKLLDFYLNSSIHVSLSVIALCIITSLHFQLSLDLNFLLFIFLSSITGYNFVKFAGIAKLHHRSLTKNLKVIQVFSLICFLALVYFVFQVPFEVLLGGALLGLFTLLYAIPVFSRKRNLRALAGMKVLVIALVWAGVTVILPLVNENMDLNTSSGIEFLQRFLFVLVLMLPFEIRDLKFDKKELRTIPQRMGVGGTKKLGYLLLIGWCIAEVFKETASFASVVSIGVSALVTAFVLSWSKEEKSAYFSSFWVEAIPLLWLLVLWTTEKLL